MNHKHKWKRTGDCRYSCPAQFQYKCSACGRTKWKEDPTTGIKIITGAEAEKRFAKYYAKKEN